jgi:hypothetical protein
MCYSGANLSVNGVLGEVDKGYLEKVVGFLYIHTVYIPLYILGRDGAPDLWLVM